MTALGSQLGHCLPTLDAGDVRLRWLTEADVPALFTPARRALERLGFVREGQLRQHYWVRGEPQDAVMFGLLRSEWAPRAKSSA